MTNLGGWILALVGLVALAGSGWWLLKPDAADEAEEAARPFVLPVTLAQVERADVHPRIVLSGTVRAARRASLGFDARGLLVELSVAEGDHVDADQVLGRLSRGDEEHELAAAKAALDLARRQQELLQAGERDEEKRRLKAVLEAARAQAELARLEVERAKKLLQDRIIAQSEQDRRETEFEAADKLRVAAEEEYARALAGTRPEDLAIAQARVAEAQTRVKTAEFELEKTQLVAPWPGTIVRRFVSVGDYLSDGDPVFELVDLENLEVHVEVPGRFAPRLEESGEARVTLPGEDRFAIEKKLDTTIPAADELARSFRAIVRLGPGDDPEHRLKPGMFAEVELTLRPVVGGMVVPSDCVLAGEHGTFIVRGKPSEGAGAGPPGLVAEILPVRVVAQADARSAVESLGPPLGVGDSIVLTGADNAFPGATLLPRGDETAAPDGGPATQPTKQGEESGEVARE